MTASGPLVTVAMPLYNAAGSLTNALRLIREQTYSNLDIVLCDNASTDATPDICGQAVREDSRIRYVRQDVNVGPVANFNRCLQLKRGEYFMWAAHDDEKAVDYVEDTVAALAANPDSVLAHTWTLLITREGERVHRPYSPDITSHDIARRAAAFVADPQCVAFYGLFRGSALDRLGPVDRWLDNDRRYLFRAVLEGGFEIIPKTSFRFRLMHTVDDYVRMGFSMRPGAEDYDLDLYRYFPELMRQAGIDRNDVRRATAAMRATLAPYLRRRAEFLIAEALRGDDSPRRLFALAKQYPPMLRMRMFWGAVRRLTMRRRRS